MKVYGQLEFAQLQNLASDPASPGTGFVYFNTTSNIPRCYLPAGWRFLATLDASDNFTVGSDAATSIKSVNLRVASGYRPEINFFQNSVAGLTIGVSSALNDLLTGVAAGRAVLRSSNEMYFTATGSQAALIIGTADTVTAPQGVFVDDQANQTALNFCREGSMSVDATGPFATQSLTVQFSRVGRQVTLHFPSCRPNGNSTAAPITLNMTNLPSTHRPVGACTILTAMTTNNGSDQASPAALFCTTSGNFTMTLSGQTTNFTSSATTTGFYGFSVSYMSA